MSERRPIPFKRFGSLRLDLPGDEVGMEEAIWSVDVDWNDRAMGSLKPRPGTSVIIGKEAAESYSALIGHRSLTEFRYIVLQGQKTLVALTLTGTVKAELAYAVAEEKISSAAFGSPSVQYTFISSKGKPMVRYSSAAGLSEPTATVNGVAGKAMPRAQFVVVWPEGDNRLLAIGTEDAKHGPGEAESSRAHVWFAEPGNPEEWNTEGTEKHPANYEQLSPGDNEEFKGACVWNGQVFIFKKTKMFVFYSVGTDSAGDPVFNYRTVDLGTEIINRPSGEAGYSDSICTAGPDAVYFVSADGLFATTGGSPVSLSHQLSKLGRDQGPIIGPAEKGLESLGNPTFNACKGVVYIGNRLYLNAGTAVLVYDLDRNAWLIWSAAMNSAIPWATNFITPQKLYFTGSEKKNIYRLRLGEEGADVLATRKPTWQSGFYDLGTEDEKTLVEAKIWGSGQVTMASFKDFAAEPGFSEAVVLPEGTVVNQGRVRKAQTGTFFSHRIELAEGAKLQRLVRYLREAEVSGGKTGSK